MLAEDENEADVCAETKLRCSSPPTRTTAPGPRGDTDQQDVLDVRTEVGAEFLERLEEPC